MFPGVGVAGVAGVTDPGGSGSDVVVLADPGKTIGFFSSV